MCWLPSRYGTQAFDARQAAVLDAVYAALG
jgi:hypothetical protein